MSTGIYYPLYYIFESLDNKIHSILSITIIIPMCYRQQTCNVTLLYIRKFLPIYIFLTDTYLFSNSFHYNNSENTKLSLHQLFLKSNEKF